jgi:hypothetical protein
MRKSGAFAAPGEAGRVAKEDESCVVSATDSD